MALVTISLLGMVLARLLLTRYGLIILNCIWIKVSPLRSILLQGMLCLVAVFSHSRQVIMKDQFTTETLTQLMHMHSQDCLVWQMENGDMIHFLTGSQQFIQEWDYIIFDTLLNCPYCHNL